MSEINLCDFEEYDDNKDNKNENQKNNENNLKEQFDMKKYKVSESNTIGSSKILQELDYISQRKNSFKFSVIPNKNNIFELVVRTDLEMSNNENLSFLIILNPSLYPCYPPVVQYLDFMPTGKLAFYLSNLNLLKLKYWSPAKTLEYVLKTLVQIIENYKKYKKFFEKKSSKNKTIQTIMKILSHIIQLEDIKFKKTLDIETYKENNFKAENFLNNIKNGNVKSTSNKDDKKNNKFEKKTTSKYAEKSWAKGTGYGGEVKEEWDTSAYVLANEQREKTLINAYNDLLKFLEDWRNGDFDEDKKIEEILTDYQTGTIFINKLMTTTLVEILDPKKTSYKIFMCCKKILSKKTKNIFVENSTIFNKTLYDVFKNLEDSSKNLKSVQSEFKKQFIQFTKFMTKLDKICKKTIEEKKKLEKNKNTNKTLKPEEIYKEKLYKYRYQSIQDFSNGKFSYKKEVNSKQTMTVVGQKHVLKEHADLQNSELISFASSIFIVVDDANNNVMKVLITGPEDTPYANGCFFFDIFIPFDYPQKNPSVNFLTTGGGTERFNPNLYSNGKVCLSLLGTWSGPGWNPATSTIFQVLLSIQSNILVEKPYFNEPGYESSMGTLHGEKRSSEYNEEKRILTMQWGMIDVLKNPPKGFEKIIKYHFSIKKDKILEDCKKWVDSATKKLKIVNDRGTQTGESKDLITVAYDKLKKILNNL